MGAVTAAVVVGAAGAYAASREARKGAQAQADAAQAAASAFRGIPIPTIEEQSIILQNPDLMGQYTPEQIQVMQEMTQSAMENVKADPNAVEKQNEALNQINEIAQGGFTEGDMAAMRQSERGVNQANEARQKAILNAMASRGVLGSGMELAARLQSNQQAADQSSQQTDRILQEAQARSLAALGQQGSLAGQMRQQSVNEQTDVARARDAINQFNIQNRQRVAEANVANRNQAQMYNLQQKQALEDQRAALANQQQMHNKSLYQTQFANRMGKEGQVQQANMAVANAQANMANARAAGIQGMTQAIGGGLMGYAGMQNANTQADLNRANALEIAKYTGKG